MLNLKAFTQLNNASLQSFIFKSTLKLSTDYFKAFILIQNFWSIVKDWNLQHLEVYDFQVFTLELMKGSLLEKSFN